MPYRICLADSEVGSVTAHGETLWIRCSAASAVDAATGTDGYLKAVVLRLDGATWQAHLTRCLGPLKAGRLEVDGAVVRTIPLPYHIGAPVRLDLRFRNGETLIAQSQALAVSVDGEPVFFESYAC